MKVRFTETSFQELLQIYAYVAGNDLAAARTLMARVEHIIGAIGDFPELAHVIGPSGIRVFPTPPYPFLIFYTVSKREVIIRNIRYAGRNRK